VGLVKGVEVQYSFWVTINMVGFTICINSAILYATWRDRKLEMGKYS
jgi:hypothetical protein